jgi:hypothetical protein
LPGRGEEHTHPDQLDPNQIEWISRREDKTNVIDIEQPFTDLGSILSEGFFSGLRGGITESTDDQITQCFGQEGLIDHRCAQIQRTQILRLLPFIYFFGMLLHLTSLVPYHPHIRVPIHIYDDILITRF